MIFYLDKAFSLNLTFDNIHIAASTELCSHANVSIIGNQKEVLYTFLWQISKPIFSFSLSQNNTVEKLEL